MRDDSPRLSDAHLDALARLAVLRPDAADRADLARRLEKVLAAVDVLHAASLDDVPPTERLAPPPAPPREDVPTPPADADPLPAAVPRAADGGVRMPAPRAGEEAT